MVPGIARLKAEATGMTATPGRIVVTILFVVVGLPPGLCSLYYAPTAISMLGEPDPEGWGVDVAVRCLVGFAIFGGLLCLLIWTWRRKPPSAPLTAPARNGGGTT